LAGVDRYGSWLELKNMGLGWSWRKVVGIGGHGCNWWKVVECLYLGWGWCKMVFCGGPGWSWLEPTPAQEITFHQL
jgi:hypothetical protein